MRGLVRPFALLVLVALVWAAPAAAKAPPNGKYDCTIGGSTLFGTLTVKSKGRYTHRGTKGAFTAGRKQVKFSDGIVGYSLSFKGGSLNKFKGRWYKAKGGPGITTYEIALKNPKDGFESIYCDKR